MSIIRKKYLKRAGCRNKRWARKIRKYAMSFPKCNKRFAVNNFCFHLGINEIFSTQKTELKP